MGCLGNLNSGLEVAIGFGIAYLALDPFRYRKKIEVCINARKPKILDTLKLYKKKFPKISINLQEEEVWGAFSAATNYKDKWPFRPLWLFGSDKCLVSIITIINYSLLSLIAFYTDWGGNYSVFGIIETFTLIYISSLAGVVYPAYLVVKGNIYINKVNQHLTKAEELIEPLAKDIGLDDLIKNIIDESVDTETKIDSLREIIKSPPKTPNNKKPKPKK